MPSQIEELTGVMQDPAFYPHDVGDIQLEETHISKVFLTGPTVYKIKKPVRMGFLDFSTLDLRKKFCHEEVALNRRLAPDVYESVVPISLENGRYRLGDGNIVEYAVKMRQLSSKDTMKRLLRDEKISAAEIDRLAVLLADFYKNAATGNEIDAMGSPSVIEKDCEDNFRQTADSICTVIDPQRHKAIHTATRNFLRSRPELFAHRVRSGKIRDAHGDLRAGHIYFSDDGIRIIDCIEFNKQFRYVDTICDLAFLTMDLDFLGFTETARALFGAYLANSGDFGSFHLLSFYQCYRAMVRVKVDCLRLKQTGLTEKERKHLIEQTNRYMALARNYSKKFSRPVLWVVCGLIATGKSTVACGLAEALNISVYHSDQIRKEIAGSGGPVPYGEGNYTKKTTEDVYGKLLNAARKSLETGKSVILDATFGTPRKRAGALQLAGKLNARAIFIECCCSEDLIRKRLTKREEEKDPLSDARIGHLEPIKAAYRPPDEIDPDLRIIIDTEKPVDRAIQRIFVRFA